MAPGCKHPQTQRGLAAVEFVIVTPLLVFLIYAIAEVSRALIQYATLSNAVRNSVRFVAAEALAGSTGVININGTLQTQGKNLVVYGRLAAGTPLLPGLTPGQVTVGAAGADNVVVSAAYPYAPIFGATLPTFGLTQAPLSLVFNMTVTSTMRALP